MSKPEKHNWHDERRATRASTPPGRYLLRGWRASDDPYEAEIVEWSDAGRVKLRFRTGVEDWREGEDIPFVVEKLATPSHLRCNHDG